MDESLLRLLQSTLLGLGSALALELVKQRLAISQERRRRRLAAQQQQIERLNQFLAQPAGLPSTPAWLKQLTVARRAPLARIGLRRDDDFPTARRSIARRFRPRAAGGRSEGRPGWPGNPGRQSPRLMRWSFLPLRSIRRLRSINRLRKPNRRKHLLTQSQIIGRSSRCDLQLLDPAVSLVHALIRFEDGVFMIYDLGSTCGTYVNGNAIAGSGRPLQSGDLLILGDTVLKFQVAR